MPHKEQALNDWAKMLHSIYGLSQNYARTEFEILAHLSEVTGAFGKFLFKLRQPDRAQQFLPKMFGWAVALSKKVEGDKANLEEIILTKYPSTCPYCLHVPCACTPGKEQSIDRAKVRDAYLHNAPGQGRTLNDLQIMFQRIYENTWGLANVEPGSSQALSALQRMFTRLIEETSEIGESVRFVHLYPSNFDNEIADYLAWVFGLTSSIHKAYPDHREPLRAEELFWPAYPGVCTVCWLEVCDCRPSPVRELLSKPSLRDPPFIDGLTHANNRAAFDRDLAAVTGSSLPLPTPIACIRLDVDDFKKFNLKHHNVGDAALKHLVAVVRQKIRNSDRIYRVGGDEFAIMCPDLSDLEANGMMNRTAIALKEKTIPGVESYGVQPPITLSVGIAECHDRSQIKNGFDQAEKAAVQSKTSGKDKIERAE
jgi:diguanylate cyclase (GGDEF)-like protein